MKDSIFTRFRATFDAAVSRIAIGLFAAGERVPLLRLAAFFAAVMRSVGPWLPEHRVGRDNLAAAFPEKSAEERERILLEAWENLGRFAAEFIHLDRLWDYRPDATEDGRVVAAPLAWERFNGIVREDKPVLLFTGHVGNWELTALGAHAQGLDLAILYRAPSLGAIADEVIKRRSRNMGTLIPSGRTASLRLHAALQRGQHVAMLVDQYFDRGVDVTFFGRRTRANPLIAQLARHHHCPIYGARVVRLPGERFRVEVTDAIVPPCDQQGRVDIQATMQLITSILEGWVREHPEQWLWMHRRWR